MSLMRTTYIVGGSHDGSVFKVDSRMSVFHLMEINKDLDFIGYQNTSQSEMYTKCKKETYVFHNLNVGDFHDSCCIGVIEGMSLIAALIKILDSYANQ